MDLFPTFKLCIAGTLLSASLGCATTQCTSALSRVKDAAVQAALSPETAVPLAAAGVVAATGWDNDISQWAGDRTPLFGSCANADIWSNYLLGGSRMTGTVTALAAYGARRKLELLGISVMTNAMNDAGVASLKRSSARLRPDASDRMSFPSAHASTAAGSAVIARRGAGYVRVSPAQKKALRMGASTMAAGTAWARVEARKHHVTDVLTGAAVGAFFGNFLCNLALPGIVGVSLTTLSDTSCYTVSFAFN